MIFISLTRNINKIFTKFVKFNGNFAKTSISSIILRSVPYRSKINRTNDDNKIVPFVILLGGLPFFNKDEETPDEKFITTLKRSILCIQREEYQKAEQMLHLALRMAQDLNNADGVTYVYDVMANLAMDQGQFVKAEKLFTNVMKRLLSNGKDDENSPKVLHISAKLAHMSQLQGHLDKAQTGFEWTLNKIEENLKKLQDDKDLRELWGLTQNWYAETLMDKKLYKEAKDRFEIAYNVFKELHGNLNKEAITLLNNITVACAKSGDWCGAKKFLEEAIALANKLPELVEAGILRANLGLIYLQEGFVDKAKDECSAAWKWGKKYSSKETIEQAEYCLDKIKAYQV